MNDGAGHGVVKVMENKVVAGMPGAKRVSPEPSSFDPAAGYDRITVEGLPQWEGEPGAPLLPVKPVHILVPYKHEVTAVKVIQGPRTDLEGTYYIEPVQAPVAIGQGRQAKPTLPDPAIYQSDQVYPPRPCGDILVQKKRGYTIVTVNLFPVTYQPRSGKISYCTEMRVQIKVCPEGASIEPAGIGPDPAYADEVSILVENPETLGTYSEETEQTTQSDGSALPPGPFEYVIITNNALLNSSEPYTFQDLIDAKMQRGLTAALVTVEEDIYPYYGGTENGDNADRIRQFIADAYANWGTRWVLLGGDVDIIPKRGVYVASGSYVQTSMPTDLYYACLDGPWNGDGDSYWGEYNDGPDGGEIDLSAEVYVGRAPVSNSSELSNFAAKTIQYETMSHSNNRTAVFLGEKLDDYTWGSYSSIPIKEQCLPADWTVVERYDSAGGWSGSTFIEDLNAGPHVITHLGHANATYNARIKNDAVAGLVNYDPYIMYSQGCLSGAFDTTDIAIAEQHAVSTGGAVAVVMNARYGWYAPGSSPAYSHYYALEFWDAVFNEGKVHFGRANQDARDDNLFRVGSTGTYRWIHFETNLFGDPETPFQLAPPPVPSEINGMVVEDANGNGVKDAGEYGVAGELVFLDTNNNGAQDSGELGAVTGTDGRYSFSDLEAGIYYVRHSPSSYWEHTAPLTGVHKVSLGEGEAKDQIDFLINYSPPLPPEAPDSLTAHAVSETGIDLNWQDRSDNEEWFKVERSTDGVSFKEIAHVSANVTAYTDTGLVSSTTYTYRVRASNEGGDSDYSNAAWATTDAPPPPDIVISYVKPSQGNPGDGVRIGGSNFGPRDASSRVHFEGDNESGDAPITVWNDGMIKCTVPDLPAGEYLLTVVTSMGESAGVGFTVFGSLDAPPPPDDEATITITSISATEGAPGTALRIKGANFGNPDGSSKVLFGSGNVWAEAPVSLWRDGQIKCAVPLIGPGVCDVKVVTGSGESNSVSFTVL